MPTLRLITKNKWAQLCVFFTRKQSIVLWYNWRYGKFYAEVINLGDPDIEHGEHSENISVKYENP